VYDVKKEKKTTNERYFSASQTTKKLRSSKCKKFQEKSKFISLLDNEGNQKILKRLSQFAT
jgi:hypothetical protein